MEERGFVIVSVGIGVAVRPFQACREAPALAGANRPRGRFLERLVVIGGFVPAVIPRQEDMAGDDRRAALGIVRRGLRRFDVELETFAALEALRQRRDHAGEFDIASFPGRGKLIGEPLLREPRGPRETEQRAADECQGAKARRLAAEQEGTRAERSKAGDGRAARQFALHLQENDAAGESKNGKAHADPEPSR